MGEEETTESNNSITYQFILEYGWIFLATIVIVGMLFYMNTVDKDTMCQIEPTEDCELILKEHRSCVMGCNYSQLFMVNNSEPEKDLMYSGCNKLCSNQYQVIFEKDGGKINSCGYYGISEGIVC